ncbi:hypothetical protein V7x_54780 [Crateriforma conspicua]|uniref:Uncharacterized protein n=1 Tax=Crateriforma conspicua TaxID=2527996 RepID=A0A5C6FJ43_9PLAN|nr:hypothetical protein V7x_54780 [Crateriforma conspicua]
MSMAKTTEKPKKTSMPGAGLDTIEIHAANHGIFQGSSGPLARKAAQIRREKLNRTAGTHSPKKAFGTKRHRNTERRFCGFMPDLSEYGIPSSHRSREDAPSGVKPPTTPNQPTKNAPAKADASSLIGMDFWQSPEHHLR